MRTAISANHGMGWGLVRDGKALAYIANVVVSMLHRKDTLYDLFYTVTLLKCRSVEY